MRLLLLLLPFTLACKPSSTATTTTTINTTTTTTTPGHIQTRPLEDKDATTDLTTDPTTDQTTDPTEDPTTDPTEDMTTDPTEDITTDPATDTTVDPTVDPTTDTTLDADTTTAPIDCPEGWIDATEDGLGCLYFVNMDEGINWLATQTICQSNNGYSVEALDMVEVVTIVPTTQYSHICSFQAGNLFNLALLTSYFSHRETWWLGLTDLARSSFWKPDFQLTVL